MRYSFTVTQTVVGQLKSAGLLSRKERFWWPMSCKEMLTCSSVLTQQKPTNNSSCLEVKRNAMPFSGWEGIFLISVWNLFSLMDVDQEEKNQQSCMYSV